MFNRDPSTPVQRLEAVVALVLTLVAVVLHLTLMQHAGGLWRDEVNSLNIARLPALGDVWRFVEFDSYPVLWFLVLRAWDWLGWAAGDTGLRVLGLLVGIMILGVTWLNGKRLGYICPLLSLALFGLNPEFIRWGDSIRAYGLGCLLILLAFGLIWKVVLSPTRASVAVASIISVLSVQCLYYNSILLGAILLAGIVVVLRKGFWKRALLLAGIELAAVCSILPYLAIIGRAQEWIGIMKVTLTGEQLFIKVTEVLTTGGKIMSWVWAGLLVLTVVAAIAAQFRPRGAAEIEKGKDLCLFCGMALVVGVSGYLLFLKKLSMPTQPWYYFTLMVFAGLCMETVLSVLASKRLVKILRLVLVIIIGAYTIPAAWQRVHDRQTNMDLIASKLETKAGKGDMILVSPWYLSISFQYHYKGAGRCLTLPQLKDPRTHRYDLIKEKMTSVDPVGPVLSAMAETLKNGRKVWIVGWMHFLPPGPISLPLPPAPASRFGWSETAYMVSWSAQVGRFIQSNGLEVDRLQVGTDKPVSRYEKCSVMVVQGWKG